MAKPNMNIEQIDSENEEQEGQIENKLQTLLYVNHTIDNDESKQLYSFDMFRAQEIFHSEYYESKNQMIDYAYERAKVLGWTIDKVLYRKTEIKELGGQ